MFENYDIRTDFYPNINKFLCFTKMISKSLEEPYDTNFNKFIISANILQFKSLGYIFGIVIIYKHRSILLQDFEALIKIFIHPNISKIISIFVCFIFNFKNI